MTSKEFDKIVDSSRKSVGRKFGFKKCGYISYKVVNGYFFCIKHLTYDCIYLYVKPFYADDLWCDIFKIPEAKKPISLRGNGAFTLDEVRIDSYDVLPGNIKNYSESDIWNIWESVFKEVDRDIFNFISKNPSADLYMPPATSPNGDPSLLYLMALLHNHKISEVINFAETALQKGKGCGMARRCGEELIDGYSFILDYANSIS